MRDSGGAAAVCLSLQPCCGAANEDDKMPSFCRVALPSRHPRSVGRPLLLANDCFFFLSVFRVDFIEQQFEKVLLEAAHAVYLLAVPLRGLLSLFRTNWVVSSSLIVKNHWSDLSPTPSLSFTLSHSVAYSISVSPVSPPSVFTGISFVFMELFYFLYFYIIFLACVFNLCPLSSNQICRWVNGSRTATVAPAVVCSATPSPSTTPWDPRRPRWWRRRSV